MVHGFAACMMFSYGRRFAYRDRSFSPPDGLAEGLQAALTKLALAIPTAFVLRHVLRWIRRFAEPGECQGCGFDLAANQSGLCPECGLPVGERPERGRRVHRWAKLGIGAVIAIGSMVWLMPFESGVGPTISWQRQSHLRCLGRALEFHAAFEHTLPYSEAGEGPALQQLAEFVDSWPDGLILLELDDAKPGCNSRFLYLNERTADVVDVQDLSLRKQILVIERFADEDGGRFAIGDKGFPEWLTGPAMDDALDAMDSPCEPRRIEIEDN